MQKRGLLMQHSKSNVEGHRETLALQETLCTDEITTHAVCVRTAMISLCCVLNFLRSDLQENIPLLISKCRGLTCVNPTTKVRKFHGILTIKRGDPAKFWLKSPHFYGSKVVKVC